jgi:hypothetical protein
MCCGLATGRIFILFENYGRSTVCYLTWKVQVTPANRLYFQLAPSTPRIGGTGFSLLPTMTAAEGEHPGRVKMPKKGQQIHLSEIIRLWPTPKATVIEESVEAWDKHRRIPGNKMFGPSLNVAVKMWPTPKASMTDMFTMESQRLSGTERARMKDSGQPFQAKVSGSLNPMWVEWLMGFPAGWTDYFQNITTLPALERERRRLAKLHHPDVAGGSLTVMQEINAEYERVRDRLSSPLPPPGNIAYTYSCPRQQTTPVDLSALLEQMMREASESGRRRIEQEIERQRQRHQYRSQVDRQRQKWKEESEVEDDDDYSGG